MDSVDVRGIRVQATTLTREQFSAEVFVDGTLNPRFSLDETLGEFLPFSVSIDDVHSGRSWFPVIRAGTRIIGFAHLMISSFSPKYLTLHSFVIAKGLRGLRRSNNVEAQQLRLSEQLVEEMVSFAKSEKLGISVPAFSSQGRERIRQKIIDTCQSEGVPLLIPGRATEILLRTKKD